MKKNILFVYLFILAIFPTHAQWTQTNGPEGGDTSDIVELGSDLFLSASEGGVYKSTDQGESWFAVNTGLPSNRQSLALVGHGDEIYVSLRQNGIYKSSDGGSTWLPLNSGIESETFYTLLVDGSNIYAGNANGGITYSNDGGLSYSYVGDNISGNQFKDIAVHESKVYAAGNGLFVSVDEGASWEKVNIQGDGPIYGFKLLSFESALYVLDNNRVFKTTDNLATWSASQYFSSQGVISISAYEGVLYLGATYGDYYVSDNQGLNWIFKQNPGSTSYSTNIWAKGNRRLMTGRAGVFDSDDSGTTWSESNSGIKATYARALYSNDSHVFAGTFGQGIFRSSNSGDSWQSANTGLEDSSSKDIYEILEVEDTIYIATERGIFSSANNGASWTLRLDPGLNQNTRDMAYDNGLFVTATSGSSIYLSSDMTQSWSQIPIDVLSQPVFFWEVAMQGDTIAISTDDDIYVSLDLGETWRKTANVGNSLITGLEISGDKVYMSNYNGVYVSDDFGASWEILNNSFRPYGIRDLRIMNNIIYVASQNGFFVTAEDRNEWYSLSEGLDEKGLWSLTIGENYVYAGVGTSSVWKLSKSEAALPPPIEYPFVTRWYTGSPGTSENNQITIPTHPGETYDYNVDWGDGTTSEGVTGDITHTYSDVGSYTVSISGQFPRIYFNNSGDADKLSGIENWGSMKWTSMENAFSGCKFLSISAYDEPDFNRVTSTERMFANCSRVYGRYSSMNAWDMSSIRNMKYMFSNVESIEADISSWNVSNVSDMEGMFENGTAFQNDLSNWNVGQVVSMKNMFKGALAFNTDITQWNVSNVENMSGMFQGALNFDQDLSDWNVSSVRGMEKMFLGVSLSMENYDALLTGWSGLSSLQNDVVFDAGLSEYCSATAERQNILDNYNWTIKDAGESCTIDTDSFIMAWKTDNRGQSDENQIIIPTAPNLVYDYRVEWGDGTFDEGLTGVASHTYEEPGTYQVSISGTFPRIFFDNSGDREKIIQILQWGTTKWASMQNAFSGCHHLDVSAEDIPNLERVTSMASMFMNCWVLKANDYVSMWNTSEVVDMSSLFQGAYDFDINITDWNVGKVTNMSGMFQGINFNQPIGSWDVGAVTDMSRMFLGAFNFNQDISNWNTASVRNMTQMFSYANSFNQNLASWNVALVTDMSYMFNASTGFNQDISSWDTGNVTNMKYMFNGCREFNQDLGNWNVAKVIDMQSMFQEAEIFDQNLADWDIRSVQDMTLMFKDVVLSSDNYDNTLIAWASNPNLQNGVVFDAGNSKYCLGEQARQDLVSVYGWTITDKGQKCPISTDSIWLEAECAQYGTQWVLTENQSASKGQSLSSTGNSFDNPPVDSNAFLSYKFNAKDGMYKVYARSRVSDQGDDSFWIRANGGTWYLWDPMTGSPELAWNQVSDSNNDQALVLFDLLEGENTLDFAIHEAGVELDKIFVTNTNELPTEFGDLATNCPLDPFVTTWKTDIRYQYDTRITIPTFGSGYNYSIDWGDGTLEEGITGEITHWYQEPGTYQVSISGDFPRLYFSYGQDREKIVSVDAWGEIEWFSMERAFQGCENLVVNADDLPNLSLVTSTNSMFSYCKNLVGNEHFNSWDVSLVKDFRDMFAWTEHFDSEISGWNVSSGERFSGMFTGAQMFNRPIGTWDMHNAKELFYMFSNTQNFNQDLSEWEFPQVANLNGLFQDALAFDQDLGDWDISNVTTMWNLLDRAGLSRENYDSTLIKWAESNSLNYGVPLGADGVEYCLGTVARNKLINEFSWSINDAGENCSDTPPVVDAGDNQIIVLPTVSSATFTGTVTDPDGGTVESVEWTQIEGPDLALLEGQNTTTLIVTGLVTGSYIFRLTATDDEGDVAFDEVVLEVQSGGGGIAPIVNAGEDVQSLGNSVTLIGVGSDPDGGTISYLWTQVSGPNTAELSGVDVPELLVNNLILGEYTFRLTVEDEDTDSAFDEVLVTVVPDYSEQRPFVTTWKTDNSGMSEDNQISILVNSENDFVYDYTVDWGDGTYSFNVADEIIHTYSEPGTYQVSISGNFPAILLNDEREIGERRDAAKLVSIDQWGDIEWQTMERAFEWGYQMEILAEDTPDLSNVISASRMFGGCQNMKGHPSVGVWDVSNLEDMSYMFAATQFDQNIAEWDVSKVSAMMGMFASTPFNQDITQWNVANSTDMGIMFRGAKNFNQDLSLWNVSRVQDMGGMFDESALATENYDKTIIGWSSQTVQSGVRLDTDAQYCLAEAARQKLIDDFGWTITDGGKAEDCELIVGREADLIAATYLQRVNNPEPNGPLLRVQQGIRETYLKFDMSDITGAITEVRLEMQVASDPGNGNLQVFFGSSSEWTETGLNGGNKPVAVGNALATITGRHTLGQTKVWNLDVGSLSGDDTLTLIVKQNTGNDVAFASDETINAPKLFVSYSTIPEPQRPFITTWKTDNIGVSETNQITIPTFPGEAYNYTVDWGDGNSNTLVTGDITHTYAVSGTYDIEISGEFPRIYFDAVLDLVDDRNKLLNVVQWGDIQWSSMENAFFGCANLDVIAADSPDLSSVTSSRFMFYNCSSLLGTTSFNEWDTSSLSDMSLMFTGASSFDQNIGDWSTDSVRTMDSMFALAASFNQNIGNWNTGAVTDMTAMFFQASSFNQDIGNWDTGAAIEMNNMFAEATSFNQDIGNWNTAMVTLMDGMFKGATSFNQDIGRWNVESVFDMESMFEDAFDFDQDIGDWDISLKPDMNRMFEGAALSVENYDALLFGWSRLQLENINIFNGGNSQYCLAEEARQKLIDEFSWTITDGGKAEDCVEPQRPFITTWKTDNPGSSEDNQITIPALEGEVYNYVVDWGDGTSDMEVIGSITHTYDTAGIYTVKMTGNFPVLFQTEKLISVDQWGSQSLGFVISFAGCVNMDVQATDIPNFSEIGSLERMFENCRSLIGNPTFGHWDVSGIREFDSMFKGATAFNQDISRWDVSGARDLEDMFNGATSFNQNIGSWDVSNVPNFARMFSGATSFNQDLGNWDMRNADNLYGMFHLATSFDQNIGIWNIEKVFEMMEMFNGVTLSQENYDALLQGWSVQQLRNGVRFDGGNSQYCLSEEARQKIIDDFGWTIIDAGKAEDCSQIVEGEADLIEATYLQRVKNPEPNGPLLRVQEGIRETYLKFDMSNFAGRITEARLEMQVASDPGNGNLQVFLGSSSEWTETGLNGGNKPMTVGNALATITGGHTVGQTKVWNLDVGSLSSDDVLTFIVKQNSGNDVAFASDETINAPKLFVTYSTVPEPQRPFITTWKTDNTGFLEESDSQITIKTHPDEIYNYTVNWGDGTSDSGVTGDITHTYQEVGTYEVSISGSFPRIHFEGLQKIIEVNQWGSTKWSSMASAFGACAYLDVVALDVPDLSNVTDLSGMFDSCASLKGNASFNEWDTSAATNMREMFAFTNIFNQDISRWDTGSVTNMNRMFMYTIEFNQNIGAWDTGSVVDMGGMFIETTAFNQDIGGWDTSSVTNMDSLFPFAVAFNQDISGWDTSSVTNMNSMFFDSDAFNQDISSWDTGSVINMNSMFGETTVFDQNLGDWDISSVTSMRSMFASTTLSVENYDKTLQGWSAQSLQNGVEFDGGNSQYCLSEAARQKLIDDFGWIITDGGKAEDCTLIVEGEADLVHATYLQRANNPEPNGPLLRVEQRIREAYLKFDVSDFTGSITEARLEMQVASDPGNGTVEVFLGSNSNWTETGLNGSNKPIAVGGAIAAIGGAHAVGQTKVWNLDVASLSTGGELTLIVKQSSGNDVAFASDETFYAPRLYVTTTSINSLGSGANLSGILKLSPNPAVNDVRVSFESPQGIQLVNDIMVYDTTGRLVRSVSATEADVEGAFEIDVRSLPSGIYFIRTYDENGVPYQKQMAIER